MAGTAAKVMCLILMLSINEGFTQEQPTPNNDEPSDSLYYNKEFTNGNDAIDMGRTAAEDMGALMASLPVKLIHLHQRGGGSVIDRRPLLSQNNLFPSFNQAKNSNSMNDFTQEQTTLHNNQPSDSSYYNREFTNGNDAIDMGRTAAEDMGALMASPPVSLFHLNQRGAGTVIDRRQLLSQNNIFPSLSRTRHSDSTNDPQFVCFQYLIQPNVEERGRIAGRTVSPMSLPLVPLLPSTSPLGGLPVLPSLPFPIIQALLPAVDLRRRRPLSVPSLPLIPRPAAIKPLRLPPLKRTFGRSSFPPSMSNMQYTPLVLYT